MINKIDERIANPTASIWISASAGTGKTKSLIDRILSLLFNGVQPNKILCLTYTNAAANEMQERLQKIIADLHEQKNIKLEQFPQVSQSVIHKLYEQSLSTEWVSIQTIHSYCLSILRIFSIESGLQPNVKLCDDFQKKQFITESVNRVINDKKYHKDLSVIAKYSNNLHEIIKNIDLSKIDDFLKQNDQIFNSYINIFNVDLCDLNLTEDQLVQKTMKNLGLENYHDVFKKLAEQFSKSIKDTDKGRAKELNSHSEKLTKDWINIFLTDGEIRKKLCTKSTEFLQGQMMELAQNAIDFKEKMLAHEATKCNIAFFNVMREVLFHFRKQKLQNHCIDFDDAIKEAILLLHQFNWICYKIDNSIEHVLVDEAQDTSPKQWEVVKLITEEFFSNFQSTKTVFIVGDEKQSIYSFQGADVERFQIMHDFFKKSAEQCGQKFFDIQLNKSYRTTGGILDFVDNVFSDVENFSKTKHDTARDKNQGIVKIEKLIKSPDSDDDESENDFSTESQIKLAEQMAELIENAIQKQLWIPSKNCSAQPSDFLVLFQTRKLYTIKTLSNILKSKNIPVCDPDQTDLNNETIVQDLLSFAEFCLLPSNDLAFAQVLKSPLFGISDEELEEICLKRGEQNLWNYVQQIDLFEKYHLEILQEYIQLTIKSPYEFFACVLNNENFEKFKCRLGNGIVDVIDKFLGQTISYTKNNAPILRNFVTWFKSTEMKIKRDLDTQNGVKIMTAHASKGLQAPFVIIADSTYDCNSSLKKEKILESDNRLFWNFSSLVCKENRAEITRKAYDDLRAKNKAESMRLLYVAMTRAEDFLCFCGIQTKKKLPDNCWYNLVHKKWENVKFVEEQYDKDIVDIISPPKILPEIPQWYFEKEQVIQETPKAQSDEISYGNCVHDFLDKISKEKSCDINFENIYKLKSDQFQKAKTEAISVYEKFPHLFNENAMSEVELIFEKQLLRIDKILLQNNSLLIVDFKTGDRDFEKLNKYSQQLKQYEQAIIATHKYDEYTISKALLWTKTLQYEKLIY